MKPYYVTTPIYYVTDAPHIGHLYTTVAADILARYHRMLGDDVHFLTGTDEHGQKIMKKARETNETPQGLADRVVERYKAAWTKYGITHNDFIRTTEERHKKVVTQYIDALMKKGDVYLNEYEGWYCVPDETYLTETQLIDGKCPECGRPVEKLKEESYFFKMSAYAARLREYIEKNPQFIYPESRKNEVLGFLRQDIHDISISRTTITWGIDMPKDGKAKKDHKVYVWFDALTNYISALGHGTPAFEKYWASAIHIVGKDIIKFHAVYWPTFLMALGLPLPKQIVAHGWLTDSNRKISKSLGNAIDPIALADEVGVDGMRYFLFREFSFGQDGEYTKEVMYRRINSDLANDYGNSVSRVTSMILKYLGDAEIEVGKLDTPERYGKVLADYQTNIEGYHFEKALEAVTSAIDFVSKGIEESQPWALAKSAAAADQAKLRTLLLTWREMLRVASVLLYPFIPTSVEKAMETMGDAESLKRKRVWDAVAWQSGPGMIKPAKPTPLFPRLEYKPDPA